jgi:hypothetical protein
LRQWVVKQEAPQQRRREPPRESSGIYPEEHVKWATASDAYPIPDIRHRLAELAHRVAQATRAMSRGSTHSRPKPRRYRGHREAFIEDAAMAREMLRL